MGLLRSEEMVAFDLVTPVENAWQVFDKLGRIDALELVDLNSDTPSYNKRYAGHIQRCDEAERQIRELTAYLEKFHLSMNKIKDADSFLYDLDKYFSKTINSNYAFLDGIESELTTALTKMDASFNAFLELHTSRQHLIERMHVLMKFRYLFFPDVTAAESEGEAMIASALGRSGGESPRLFRHLSGVVNQEDAIRLKRVLFRVSRGNSLVIMHPIQEKSFDPKKQELVKKNAFIVFFSCGRDNILENKIASICETMEIFTSAIPLNAEDFDLELRDIGLTLKDKDEILKSMEAGMVNLLRSLITDTIPNISKLEMYRGYLKKEKLVSAQLNMMEERGSIFIGMCWVPRSKVGFVYSHLVQLQKSHIYAKIEERATKMKPPTYFKLNTFTAPFQEVVDTYGVPSYGEVNPGLFTIVTFPFQFGMMFGDIGHGGLLLLFALFLVLGAKKLKGTALEGMLSIRYLLLLMATFAFFNGWIYNDFFALPVPAFSSCYTCVGDLCEKEAGCVYPFGIDWTWHHSNNNLTFINSFKMKTAVIFGVAQMLVGICCKGINAIHLKKPLDFIFEFIPQLIFMVFLFAYMDFLIFYKWSVDWSDNPSAAPGIIKTMMNMGLKQGKLVDAKPMWGDVASQDFIQTVFIGCAFVCVFLMLLPKPILLKKQANARKAQHRRSALPVSAVNATASEDLREPLLNQGDVEAAPEALKVKQQSHLSEFDDEEEEEEEYMIHQMIETIEYVLGAVSNTASYLRLWALSLAHSQLAKVFFEKCLYGSITAGSPFFVVIGFIMWANATFGVLMCMDSMECFLHALRLHWVEFQNKFYEGEGYKFKPFSCGKGLVQG